MSRMRLSSGRPSPLIGSAEREVELVAGYDDYWRDCKVAAATAGLVHAQSRRLQREAAPFEVRVASRRFGFLNITTMIRREPVRPDRDHFNDLPPVFADGGAAAAAGQYRHARGAAAMLLQRRTDAKRIELLLIATAG